MDYRHLVDSLSIDPGTGPWRRTFKKIQFPVHTRALIAAISQRGIFQKMSLSD